VTSPRLRIRGDGTLLLSGRPLRRPLLVDGYANWIRLADADVLGSSPSSRLWQPRGDARLSLLVAGLYSDGWLSALGRVYVWPQEPGRLRLTLMAPPQGEPMTMRFDSREVRLLPGVRRVVEFDVCSRGLWQLTFASSSRGFVGSRVVGAFSAAEPEFVPGPCAPRTGAEAV
jgi:hypothetical protein